MSFVNIKQLSKLKQPCFRNLKACPTNCANLHLLVALNNCLRTSLSIHKLPKVGVSQRTKFFCDSGFTSKERAGAWEMFHSVFVVLPETKPLGLEGRSNVKSDGAACPVCRPSISMILHENHEILEHILYRLCYKMNYEIRKYDEIRVTCIRCDILPLCIKVQGEPPCSDCAFFKSLSPL